MSSRMILVMFGFVHTKHAKWATKKLEELKCLWVTHLIIFILNSYCLRKMVGSRKVVIVLFALFFYTAALLLPCYDYTHLDEGGNGYQCLIMGWFSFLFIADDYNPFPLIAWISNFPFFIGLLVYVFAKSKKSYRASYLFLLTALFMSLGSLIHYSRPNLGHADYYPEYGCFVWILSYAVLCYGAYSAKQNVMS